MAYWCTEQWEVTVEGPAGRSVVSPDKPFARIGRHPDSDIVIPDSTVALRSHYLHATRDGVYCLFLDVAGSRPDEKGRWLEPGEEIAVGHYRMRASLVTAEQGEVLPEYDLAAWGSALPPLPVMLVYCGELLKDKRRFRARLSLVGRRPQCRLQLKGKQVSSFHCALFWDREQLWCIDLLSSNGTILNERQIDCEQVQIGDRLEVGEFGLVFQRRSQGSGQSRSLSARPAAGATSAGNCPSPQPERAQAAPTVQRSPPEPKSAAPVSPPDTSSEEYTVESAEDRRLREQLAEEVARLGSEREVMQARWNAASEQLGRQVVALQNEAAQLAREREALAGARSQFLDERNAQTHDIAERSAKLAQLEAELASATAALEAHLLEAKQGRTSLSTATDVTDLLAAEIARAAIVTGISHELPDELTSAPAHVQQILADATWEPAPADADGETASVAPQQPAAFPPAPLQYLQLQWEETSERLRSQVEQLQGESSALAKERLALEQSRQDWQAERRALTDQLLARAGELAKLETELANTTAELRQRLAEAEARREQEAACARDQQPAALNEPPLPVDGEWLSQLSPGAIVAGLDPDAASQIAAPLAPEVAFSYAPNDLADDFLPQPDVQTALQARWEATSQELAAQVEQLRAQASQLAADRQAFLQLANQQAELKQAASSLTARLSDVEQRFASPSDPAGWSGVAPQSPVGVRSLHSAAFEPATSSPHVSDSDIALDGPTPSQVRQWTIDESLDGMNEPVQSPPVRTPPPVNIARRHDTNSRNNEHLSMLVSSRVGEKYAEQKRRLIWWSAGGIAALILLATIVAGVMWVL